MPRVHQRSSASPPSTPRLLPPLRNARNPTPHPLPQIGGDNGIQLSTGQQQLLCLARALLRRSRLLLLDECTSSVDPATAAVMRTVLAQQRGGADTTVIQIAHDLRAISGYDRVLLMERGRVVEDGAPEELVRAGDTRFAQLLARAGRMSAGG